jgi:tetratricopeptide (TPR) repeat protein
VQTLVGSAGSGKTRLATEFMAQVAALEPGVWDAGFVGGVDWPWLPTIAAPSGPLWRRPTLLVVDAAAVEVQHLRLLLGAAVSQRGETCPPLRILLLARQADSNKGWLRYLQEDAATLFDPLEPSQLSELPDRPFRQHLWEEVRRGVAHAGSVAPEATKPIDEGLPGDEGLATGAGTAKLLLAAVLAATTGTSPRALLPRSRIDLAFALADLELDRLAGFAPSYDPAGRQWLTHLAACATVVGGLSANAVAALAEDEQRALHWPSAAITPVLAGRLSRAFPNHGGGGVRVAHELVGGALVLRVLGRQTLGEAGGRVLQRLARRWPCAVATFLTRLAGDFAGLYHPEPLEWLGLVLDTNERPQVGWLLEAERNLPIGIPGIRALTTQLSGRLIEALQRLVPGVGSRALAAELARLLGRLSWRLSDSGHREAALEKAQQAEVLCLELAKAQPAEYRADWASAVEVLACRLSDLGLGDEAVARARQAEAAHAALAAQTEDQLLPEPSGEDRTRSPKFELQEAENRTPKSPSAAIGIANRTAPGGVRAGWASSLQVTATVLERSLRFEEAREKAAKAAEVYRQLAADNPEAFLPDLAAAQSRLAVLLGLSGRTAEALEIKQQAENTCRGCRPRCPDWTSAVCAASLGMLAGHFGRSGLREESLACANQALGTWRALGPSQPAAFLPDLGRALHRLAVRLSEFGHDEEALAHFAEAERVFIELARVDPGTFLSDLAVTKLDRASALAVAGEWTTALETVKEVETMLQSMAEAQPEVFLPVWAKALAVEGACYRSLPHLADEIEHYGRQVIACCAMTRTRSTISGAVPEVGPDCAR